MKRIRLMNWDLEVDINKTKEYYNKDIELCHCSYCENYMEACKVMDSSILEFITSLGINSLKPIHLSEFGEVEEKVHLYMGCYHIVGVLIEGEYCTDSDWNETNTAKIGNFTLGFNKELMFVQDDYPRPVLQLDFEARIPWVLNEHPGD